ncbi:MAG: hypothetical protein ACYC2K_04455, partial [Gemmatimonadales bacterium]
SGHTAESVEGRVRIRLVSDHPDDLRPLLSRVAIERGWVLWELYRERATVEQLFQTLTSEGSALLGVNEGEGQ